MRACTVCERACEYVWGNGVQPRAGRPNRNPGPGVVKAPPRAARWRARGSWPCRGAPARPGAGSCAAANSGGRRLRAFRASSAPRRLAACAPLGTIG